MDQLVVANTINNEVEKENISGLNDEEESEGLETTHPRDTMTNSDEEEEKSVTPRSEMDKEVEELMTSRFELDKEAKESAIPRSEMGSNNVNSTPRKFGFVHFVRHKSPKDS
jgi:hypothetical protein